MIIDIRRGCISRWIRLDPFNAVFHERTNGASRVLDKAQDMTGIKPGETDLELKFSLETVNCLGCCALGPVMEIDGTTHGKLSAGDTADVLQTYE